MANGRNEIWYAQGVDNSGLKQGRSEAKTIWQQMEGDASRTGANVEKIWQKAGKAIGVSLAGISIGGFVKKMFQVRAEFQDAESAMTLFLGSAEKAGKFMKELQGYAWYNAFEFSDLVAQSKQLLAYGNDVETVIGTLDKLSNVAVATKQPLGSLVDLYNKAKNIGSIDSVGLKQWAAAGLVITDVLDEMGLNVDRSSVKFEHLEMVLNKVTSEGGKFHKQMETMMPNLSMSLGQLQDDITNMFNELGQQTEGTMKDAIEFASYLVANYEKIGKVIIWLIATYGAYKAALIAINIIEKQRIAFNALVQEQMVVEQALRKAATADMVREAAVTKALQITKANLLKTMKSFATSLVNPYAAATVAVLALAYGVYKLATYQTDAEKAQKRLNESLNESNAAAISEQRELAKLKGEIGALEKGTKEYDNVKDKIISKYGKYYDGLKEEMDTVGLTADAYDRLSESILSSFNARQYTKFIAEESEHLDEVISTNLGKLQDRLNKRFGDELGAQYLTQIRNALLQGEELDEGLVSILNKAQRMGTIWARSDLKSLINDTKYAIQLYKETDEKAKNRFGVADSTGGVGAEIKPFKTLADQIEESRNSLSKLKTELKNLRDGIKPEGLKDGEQFDFAGGIKNKEDEIDAEEKRLNTLRGIDQKRIEAIAEQQEKIRQLMDQQSLDRKRAAEDSANQEAQAYINTMQNGFEKTEAQRELNNKIEIQNLKRQKEDYIRGVIEAARQLHDEKEKLAKQQDKDYVGTEFDPTSVVVDTSIYDTIINSVKLKQSKETLNELIEQFQTYEERLKDIVEKYDGPNGIIGQLIAAGHTAQAKEAEKARDKELSSLKREAIEESGLWSKLFQNFSNTSTSALTALFDRAEAEIKNATDLSASDLQALQNRLNEIRQELAQRNPFTVLLKSYKKYREALESGDTETANNEWVKVQAAAQAAKTSIGELGGSLSGLAGVFNDDLSSGINKAVTAIQHGIDVFEAFGKSGEKSSADTIKGISGIIGIITTLIGGIVEIFEQAKKSTEELQRSMRNFYFELDLLNLRSIVQSDAGTFRYLTENAQLAAEAYKKYADVVAETTMPEELDTWELKTQEQLRAYKMAVEAYEKGFTDLQGMQIKTKKRGWLANFLGAKDEFTYLKDLYPDLWGKDGVLDIEKLKIFLETNEKLDKTQRDQIQNIINLHEEYEEALDAIKSGIEEAFGFLETEIRNSLVDAIKNGTDAWGSFKDAGMKAIEALGEQLAYELFFYDSFEKLKKDLAAIYENEGDPEKIAEQQAALLEEYFASLGYSFEQAEAFLKEWQEKHGGWNPDDSDRTSTAKGIAQASQDSVDELNGRFMVIQEHTYDIRENTNLLVEQSKQIAEQWRGLQAHNAEVLRHLSGIHDNTNRLPQMDSNIASMKYTLDLINAKGIVVREV